MTATRQNIYDKGAYEGDARIHGDNGLGRAIAGRAQHRRALVGGFVMLADPSVNANNAGPIVVAGTHTIASPLVIPTPQAEQFTLMVILEATAALSAPSFLAMRFMLNNDFASSWLQPAPLRTYAVQASPAAIVLTSLYASPIIGSWTLSFDQILFALVAGATLNVNVQGMYSTGGARFTAAPSQNT